VSFWALLLLGIIGLVRAVRARAFVLPLLGPAIVVIFEVAISYGEPRYHAMADLSVIVFAAAAVDALLFRGTLHASMTRAAPPGDRLPPEEERVAAPVAQRSGFTKMKQ
jgi:hypothetical protein